ncbi:MAG: hypothetical protein ABI591_25520 [Kofleriaceae bacterium]
MAAGSGCDKLRKKQEASSQTGSGSGSAAPPASGHSVTKLKEDAGVVALGSGVSGPQNSGPHVGSGSGSGSAHVIGGDGSPAHRNDDGRVHGPGGPVFMGRGVECDAAHDHCLRDGVWFSVANIVAGRLFRALPVFEFEKQWFTWRGEPTETPGKVYKTQIAGSGSVAAGTAVIWFSSETSEKKFADSEYDAMTSSRWEAGVVESQTSPTMVMVKGYGAVSLDTVRLITESRAP